MKPVAQQFIETALPEPPRLIIDGAPFRVRLFTLADDEWALTQGCDRMFKDDGIVIVDNVLRLLFHQLPEAGRKLLAGRDVPDREWAVLAEDWDALVDRAKDLYTMAEISAFSQVLITSRMLSSPIREEAPRGGAVGKRRTSRVASWLSRRFFAVAWALSGVSTTSLGGSLQPSGGSAR